MEEAIELIIITTIFVFIKSIFTKTNPLIKLYLATIIITIIIIFTVGLFAWPVVAGISGLFGERNCC